MTTAIEKYQGKSREQIAEEFENYKASIATLGDSAVFVRRDAHGMVSAVKQNVKLTEKSGDIQYICKTPDGSKKYMVTVGGVARLNQVPGLNIFTPTEVIVDGKPVSNPYIERNPRTKVIQSVYVRKVVLGRNPIGNWVGQDYTLFFNIFTYFLQDLQAKIKKYPACGMLGLKGTPPKEFRFKKKTWKKNDQTGKSRPVEAKDETVVDVSSKTLHFVEIDDLVGLWIDLGHPEIQEAYNSHVQRQKFGDRHAQSICERNAILKHPAVAAKNISVTNGVATVPVFGFRHDFNAQDISKMADDIAQGRTDEMSKKGVTIDVSNDEATYEETQVSSEGDEHGQNLDAEQQESNPESEEPGKAVLEMEPEPEPEAEKKDKANKEPEDTQETVLARVLSYHDIIGEKTWRAIMKKAKVNDIRKLGKTDLENIEKVFLKPAADQG